MGDGGVRLASRTAPEDFGGTMLRLLAYMAGLAVLGGLAAILFRLPAVVAAVGLSLAGRPRATPSSAATPMARARTC